MLSYTKSFTVSQSPTCVFPLAPGFLVMLRISFTEMIQLLPQMFWETTATTLAVAAKHAYSKENVYFKNKNYYPQAFI